MLARALAIAAMGPRMESPGRIDVANSKVTRDNPANGPHSK
jgi:hypothetical protein